MNSKTHVAVIMNSRPHYPTRAAQKRDDPVVTYTGVQWFFT